MASEVTKNGDNIPSSCSALQRNEHVDSDNTQNELEMNNFSRVDDVTSHGVDNVRNPMLLPGVQDTGQQFPGNQISGAQTVEGQMFPHRIGFQIAGQEIAVARGTAQAFNVPTGPSQRGYVRLRSSVVPPSYIAHPALSTCPVQRSTRPHAYPFMPESIQAVPSPALLLQTAPFPPQTQTAAFHYPLYQTAAPVQTAPFLPQPHTAATRCPSSQTAATVQRAAFPPQAQTIAFHYPLSQTIAPVQRAPFPAQAQMAAFHHPLYHPTARVQRAPFPPQTQTADCLYPIFRTAPPTQTVHPPPPLANDFRTLHSSQGNSGQSQTSVPIQCPIRLITSAYSTVTSVARERGPVQGSDAPVQPSHRRSTGQSSRVGRAVKRRNKSTIPKSKKASVQPQAQTATALSPLTETTARSFTSSNALEASMGQPTDHISPDLDQLPELSGKQCFLCKRDLSLTPAVEGPISRPIVPPTVAVFSCGHHFHATCAETVTPVDRTRDPPCLRCIMERS